MTEACKPKCTAAFAAYQACEERIKTKPGHDCEAWYFDYYKCIDKCRAPQIFKVLK
jgi:ubiquinol-cytochrome c reductase subunit 6